MSGDIPIGVDDTDHIAFFCPYCDKALTITRVLTQNVIVRTPPDKYDKCTWIYTRCKPCRIDTGFRKFYWTVEDGQFCTNRTDK